MKINLFFVGLSLWMLCIFSIFIPFKIYIPLFMIFIIFVSVKYIVIDARLNHKTLRLALIILLFIMVGAFSTVLNSATSHLKEYVKLIINTLFLLSSVIFIQKNQEEFTANIHKILVLLELIILISFIQVAVNVHLMNLWKLPISGLSGSWQAYLIDDPTVYFGNSSKNIWATKMVFIQIIYISLIQLKLVKVKNIRWMTISLMSLFNIIYTTSRTAQLMFILPILFFVFLYFMSSRQISLKYFMLFAFGAMAFVVMYYVYNKMMHFTGDASSDGLFMRFQLWQSYFEHFNDQSFHQYLLGNGFLFGDSFIDFYFHRYENNFHNAFINTLADLGFIGLTVYTGMILSVFFYHRLKGYELYRIVVFFLPLFICINSQYLGYDNDVMVYSSLVFMVSQLLHYRTRYSNPTELRYPRFQNPISRGLSANET